MITEQLDTALYQIGLSTRGGFHAQADESLLSNMATLILIGNTGPRMWQIFSRDVPENPHPLDTWTRRVLTPVARDFGAQVVFPFDGPPYHPFQRWAMRADDVTPSLIGPLIHPVYGMWHAYRGAFLFEDRLELPPKRSTPSPCMTCDDKPCLDTCPVSAFRPGAYDVAACREHIAALQGKPCLSMGCAARRACPVGRDHIYEPDQAAFHMTHFLNAG